ncbi:Bacterial Ig-like, group 2 [Candidatus Nanopelagicaceae bacterium]
MMRKLFAALVVSTLIAPATAVGAVTIIATPTATTVSLTQKTITLTPPATNSPGAWSIEIDNPKIATANGLTLTLLSAGTSIIRYAQAASGAYNAASRSSRLTVTPGIPTLGEFKDQSVALSVGSFTLTAPTSTSDGAWSFQSLDQSIATVSGNKVTLLDGGEVSIRATQSPTLNWLTTTATMKLTVTAPSPTVGTFSDITLSIDSVSKVELILPASNSKGAWTLTSADPSVASVSGLTVTALKSGTTKISAKQAPSGGYRSIIVTLNVTILAVDPVVTASGFLDRTVEIIPGTPQQISLAAPASNSPGVWTFTSSDVAIASINGNSLTALKPGKVTVTAVQGPALKFGSSKPLTISVFVKGRQSLTAPVNVEKLAGDPDVAIAYPTSQSTGKWSATSSDPTIASINGTSIKLGNAGTATITLSQEATDSWVASSTTFSVRVIGVTPTLGAFAPFEVSVGEKLTTPKSPLSNSAGKWIYSSSDPKIVAVVDNVITGVTVGTATISAYQQPAGKYGQSNTLQATVSVKAAAVVAPTPTPKPSPSATATPATPVAVKASASLSKRVISIYVSNVGTAPIIAMIDSKVVKVGKNTVKPGKRTVRVYSGGKLILSRTFAVK